MGSRGVFFALTGEQLTALLAAEDDDDRRQVLADVEEAWDTEHLAECDKSWDALHRALGDGTLTPGAGAYPLDHCVLGPVQLLDDEDDVVSLVTPAAVVDVARALEALTEEGFARLYRTVVPPDYAPEYGDEDLGYSWDWFQEIRELYRRAAQEGRAVVFSVNG